MLQISKIIVPNTVLGKKIGALNLNPPLFWNCYNATTQNLGKFLELEQFRGVFNVDTSLFSGLKLEQHYVVRQLARDTEAQSPVCHVESKEDDGEDNSAVFVYIGASHS